MPEEDIILLLEQGHFDTRLSTWFIIYSLKKQDSPNTNSLVTTLAKSWLRHKKCLVPPHSPLQDLKYVFDPKNFDLSGWQNAGFHRLKDLFVKCQIPSSDYLKSKIPHIT